MTISVYYPYYDVYTDINTDRVTLPYLKNLNGVSGLSRIMGDFNNSIGGWLNIPDQDYIQPNSNRGSK